GQDLEQEPSSGRAQEEEKGRVNGVKRADAGQKPQENTQAERNNCPAFGKECDFCHIKNHFESKCLKKKYKRDVQEITEEMGEIREEQPGKDLILADALSRAYVIHNEEDDFDKDIESQICLVRMELNAR
ncbi:hypothetical protein YQE_09476, partial [Dendroctonus ponderosae]